MKPNRKKIAMDTTDTGMVSTAMKSISEM